MLRDETGRGSGRVSYYCGDLGCTPVVVTSSGMGSERAERCAAELIARYAPTELLIAGFAGGLSPELVAGDLVVATSITFAAESRLLSPDADLLAAARRAASGGVAAQFGALVTSDAMSVTIADKQALAARFPDAVAADMESAGAACAAASGGVPWLAVRAITDGATDPFPIPFDRYVDASGEPDRGRIVIAAITHPRSIPGLMRLGRRSALAAGNLAAFVEATVHAMRGEAR